MKPRDFDDWREWRRFRAVRLARLGWVHRDIADALCISLNRVATHVRNILAKTSTANRTEATAYALRHGLREG